MSCQYFYWSVFQEANEKRKKTIEEDYEDRLKRCKERESKTLDELHQCQESLQWYKQQLATYQTDYQKVKDLYDELSEKEAQGQKQNEELKSKVSSLEQNLKETEESLKDHKTKLEYEVSTTQASLKEQIESLKQESERNDTKLQELSEENTEKDKKICALQQSQNSVNTETSTMQQRIQALSAELSRYQQQLSSKSSEAETLKVDLNYWKESSNNLMEELKHTRESLVDYEHQLKELRDISNDYESLRKENENLKDSLKELQDQQIQWRLNQERMNMKQEDASGKLCDAIVRSYSINHKLGHTLSRYHHDLVEGAIMRTLYSFRASFHAHLASCDVTCRSQQSRNIYRDTLTSGTISRGYGERLTLESLADSPSLKAKQNNGRQSKTSETVDGILIESHQRLALLSRRMARASSLVSIPSSGPSKDPQSCIPRTLFQFIDSTTTEAHQFVMSTIQWTYASNKLSVDEIWLSEYNLAHASQLAVKYAEECASEVGRFCRLAANMSNTELRSMEDFCKSAAKLRSYGLTYTSLFECLQEFPLLQENDTPKLIELTQLVRQRTRISIVNQFLSSIENLEKQLSQKLDTSYWAGFATEDLQNLKKTLSIEAKELDSKHFTLENKEKLLSMKVDLFGTDIDTYRFGKSETEVAPKALYYSWYKPILAILNHICWNWLDGNEDASKRFGQSFEVENCVKFCNFLSDELKNIQSFEKGSKEAESEHMCLILQHSIVEHCRCTLLLLNSVCCISIPYNIWLSNCVQSLINAFSDIDVLQRSSTIRNHEKFTTCLNNAVRANASASHAVSRLFQNTPEELYSMLLFLQEQRRLVLNRQALLEEVGVDVHMDATLSSNLENLRNSNEVLFNWLTEIQLARPADLKNSLSKLLQLSVSVDRFSFEERMKCKNEHSASIPQLDPIHSPASRKRHSTSCLKDMRNQLHGLYGNGIYHSDDCERSIVAKINAASVTTVMCLHLLLGVSVEESILASNENVHLRQGSRQDTVAPLKRLEEISTLDIWSSMEDFIRSLNHSLDGTSRLCSHALERGTLSNGCFNNVRSFGRFMSSQESSLADVLYPKSTFILKNLYHLATASFNCDDLEVFHVLSRLRSTRIEDNEDEQRKQVTPDANSSLRNSNKAATDLMMELEDALDLSSIPEYPDEDTENSSVFELSPETAHTPFRELVSPTPTRDRPSSRMRSPSTRSKTPTSRESPGFHSPDRPLSTSFSITPLADHVLQALDRPGEEDSSTITPSRNHRARRKLDRDLTFHDTDENDNRQLDSSLSESQVQRISNRAYQSPKSEVKKVLSKMQEVKSTFKNLLHQLDHNVSSKHNIRRGNLEVVRSSVETATRKLEKAEEAKRSYEGAQYPKSINAAGSFIVAVYGAEAAVSALERVLNSLYRDK